ncbi:MAG: 4-hydroxy-tetrahydrodipicolinate synthase [Spirochaetes bacterium]|nr:MAG: 4-hydroxy-tetrahydrodipicolinate synthase [Spirochaetota bacterium]
MAESDRYLKGTWTALITPFTDDNKVDYEGLEKNIQFQIEEGITGILPVGTTGESPTLSPEEHDQVIQKSYEFAGRKCEILAGTGSNSTKEAIEHTKNAVETGIEKVLLIDCYYNGPSSFELREYYYSVILKEFPEVKIVLYVIPGRTGTAILPEDIAILSAEYGRVIGIKEATGDIERMKRERKLMPDMSILSGDDDITFKIMKDPDIKASGVISVISNVAPGAVSRMVNLMLEGKTEEAKKLEEKLKPLFSIVTVKAKSKRKLSDGTEVEVIDKYRNPLAIKTVMNALGMPAGFPRMPIGKMQKEGIQVVKDALFKVWRESPEILEPVGKFYNVDIEERLNSEKVWEMLTAQT